MYIRCGTCWGSTRVPFGGNAGAVTCSSCGCTYSLTGKGALGATPAERSSRAEALAAEHGIDLATAYSVLLEIIPLEAALVLGENLETASESRGIRYDPGFRDAIEKGHLAVQQAVERGDRVAYASKLAQRHGLEMSVAFLVADNRITIAEALQRNAAPPSEANAPPAPSVPTARRLPLAGALALVLVALCGWALWYGSRGRSLDGSGGATAGLGSDGASTWTDGSSATPRPRTTTKTHGQPASSNIEIFVDETGALTQVVGPDPMSVLDAFCLHPRNRSTLSPLSVASAAVRGSVDQIGLIADHEHGSEVKAVAISRDPRSRRWQIGNGQTPIKFLESLPASEPAITAGL